MTTKKERDPNELTLIERVRRQQLIDTTIESIAAQGYAGTSLAGIAKNAGITKAAVLYHFPSKDTLVKSAYEHVIGALVSEVSAAIEAANVTDGPATYIRSMIGHLRHNPRHIRMITEAMAHDQGDHDPAERWQPLAKLIAAARKRPAWSQEDRDLAVIIGGAIDGIVAEYHHDPEYDTAAAATRLVGMTENMLTS